MTHASQPLARAQTQRSIGVPPGRLPPGMLSAVLIALVAAIASHAVAEEPPDETERWVPSGSLEVGLYVQSYDGSSTSSPLSPQDRIPDSEFRPNVNGPLTVWDDATGSATSVVPILGGSFELMTPRLFDSMGRPRLFVQAGLAGIVQSDHDIVRDGTPGEFSLPQLPPGNQIPEISVVGQGTRIRSTIQSFVVTAGGGVAFNTEWRGRRLRLKPSFEYIRTQTRYDMKTNRAVSRERLTTTPDDFRYIELSAKDEVTYHGIGPGFEAEADAARLGPFMLSTFAKFAAYSLVGDLTEVYTDANEYGESATWVVSADRWVMRGFVGLRFRWLPE